MRYHCLHIETRFAEDWQKEVFDQTLCDLGVDTIDGEAYYIPSEILDAQLEQLRSHIAETEGARLLSVEQCPDENWNAVWEAEHPIQELPLGIQIIPHCAFGAGYHETTSMMIDALLHHSSAISAQPSFRVLDHGTGTGVLAIFAKRLEAAQVTAIDIDDKSVENAKENAALNGEEIEVLLGGDLRSFKLAPASFHLILANIHRNVLLANMAAYAHLLTPEGELWLSGFYETDCAVLQAAAEQEGLRVTQVLANGEWRLMKCQKAERP